MALVEAVDAAMGKEGARKMAETLARRRRAVPEPVEAAILTGVEKQFGYRMFVTGNSSPKIYEVAACVGMCQSGSQSSATG